MSDPDTRHAREAMAKLEHLVVQDLFLTETAYLADVVLPASAWPEKSGTVTNSNRQVQMGRPALSLPGDARQDWWIVQEIARRLGLDWNYQAPKDVFNEMKRVMPSLNNITWERLDAENVVTYPCPAPDHPGSDIVFGDGFPTADRRGRLVPADVLPPHEQVDQEFPYILITGRQLEHWHTGAMTRRASVLNSLEPSAVASLSPKEFRHLGIEPGDKIKVTTRRGDIELATRRDPAVPTGSIFIPFCYSEAAANVLTSPELDPVGKIPEFKYSAARIMPVAAAASSSRDTTAA
jgi:formate dehydrogenase major subunit